MRLAHCDPEGTVRPLTKDAARKLLEEDAALRREAVKWRKMTGRDGTLILLGATRVGTATHVRN